jgi:ATP-binding cassette subfamily G (WHITE) protein 2 (SNQ2)
MYGIGQGQQLAGREWATGASENPVEQPSQADTNDDLGLEPATYEDGREQLRNSNLHGLTRIQSGVDVERAERDFAELSRELSGISLQARHLSKQISRHSKIGARLDDVEKLSSPTDSDLEPWDLESTLHGSRAAEVQAGIKPKCIGKQTAVLKFAKVSLTLIVFIS